MKKVYLLVSFLLVAVGVLIAVLSQPSNFELYKDERKQMIQMVLNGEIAKEEKVKGFPLYYTPPKFKEANKSSIIDAKVYSKENHFFFFQSKENGAFGPGVIEGYLYSSTGKFPAKRDYPDIGLFDPAAEKSGSKDFHAGLYERIDENWFFVSEDTGQFD